MLLCYNGDIMEDEYEETMKMKVRELRAIDMAEYIYRKLTDYGALTPEAKKILQKIIVDLKEEIFEKMDNLFGIA